VYDELQKTSQHAMVISVVVVYKLRVTEIRVKRCLLFRPVGTKFMLYDK